MSTPPEQGSQVTYSSESPAVSLPGLLAQTVGEDIDLNVNVKQSLIITTEDKVHRCLRDHVESLEKGKEWITPAGILLSLIVTLLTAEFKDFYFPKTTWQAIFIVASVVVGVWLIKALLAIPKRVTLDDLVKMIKQGNVGVIREPVKKDASTPQGSTDVAKPTH